MRHKPKYYGHRIKCLHCETIIESKHVHDFVSCKCKGHKHVAIDGGAEYCRMIYTDKSKFICTREGNYAIDDEHGKWRADMTQ